MTPSVIRPRKARVLGAILFAILFAEASFVLAMPRDKRHHPRTTAESQEARHRYLLEHFFTLGSFYDTFQYDPQIGYYGAGKIELGLDFGTMPIALSPVWGRLLAEQALRMRQGMVEAGSIGANDPFHVVEFGAGTGIVPHDFLQYANGRAETDLAWRGFRDHLHYIIGERSEPLRQQQASLNRDFVGGPLTILSADARNAVATLGTRAELVYSNELVDALPPEKVDFAPDGSARVAAFVPVLDASRRGFAELKQALSREGVDIQEMMKRAEERRRAIGGPLELQGSPELLPIAAEDLKVIYGAIQGPNHAAARLVLAHMMHMREVGIPLELTPELQEFVARHRAEFDLARRGRSASVALAPGWADFVHGAGDLLNKGYLLTVDNFATSNRVLSGAYGSLNMSAMLSVASIDAVQRVRRRAGGRTASHFEHQTDDIFSFPGDTDMWTIVPADVLVREGLQASRPLEPIYYGRLPGLEVGTPIRVNSAASREQIAKDYMHNAYRAYTTPAELAKIGLSERDQSSLKAMAESYVATERLPSADAQDPATSMFWQMHKDFSSEIPSHLNRWTNERFPTGHFMLVQQVSGTDPHFTFGDTNQRQPMLLDAAVLGNSTHDLSWTLIRPEGRHETQR